MYSFLSLNRFLHYIITNVRTILLETIYTNDQTLHCYFFLLLLHSFWTFTDYNISLSLSLGFNSSDIIMIDNN